MGRGQGKIFVSRSSRLTRVMVNTSLTLPLIDYQKCPILSRIRGGETVKTLFVSPLPACVGEGLGVRGHAQLLLIHNWRSIKKA